QMINGGFEQYDPNGNHPDYYSIEYAYNWHNLNNTCDLGHTEVSAQGNAVPSAPRTGVGHARFGVPMNGKYEYFYGSTTPLVTGETYVVSMWVRKDYTTTNNIPVGLYIGENVPTPQILEPYIPTNIPQVRITPTSTQWVRAYFCFTPQNSVKHYVTIGPFSNNSTCEQQLFLVDDVEVTLLDPVATLPTADIDMAQNVFCIGEDAVVDGSSTTGEDAYQWTLYKLVNGTETLVYTGDVISGQAGQFSTDDIPGFGFGNDPGDCYRLYLTAFGVCKDVTSVDFCFMYPDIDFLYDGTPICEGDLVNLSVTGDNGWTYTWSDANGQLASGVGTK